MTQYPSVGMWIMEGGTRFQSEGYLCGKNGIRKGLDLGAEPLRMMFFRVPTRGEKVSGRRTLIEKKIELEDCPNAGFHILLPNHILSQ